MCEDLSTISIPRLYFSVRLPPTDRQFTAAEINPLAKNQVKFRVKRTPLFDLSPLLLPDYPRPNVSSAWTEGVGDRASEEMMLSE